MAQSIRKRRAPQAHTAHDMLLWLRDTYEMNEDELSGMFQVTPRTAQKWLGSGKVPRRYEQKVRFAYTFHRAAQEAYEQS